MKSALLRRTLLTVLLVLFLLSPEIFAQVVKDEKAEVDYIAKRFEKREYLNLFSGAMWTVSHDYKDYEHLTAVLESVTGCLTAIGKYQAGDPKPLESLGGIKAFKSQLSGLLKDPDEAIRAFSSILIGIVGDREMASDVAELLKERKPDDDRMIYDRGRAAMSLGMLGADQYKEQIAKLLKSTNSYDRSGAINALAEFGAKEYENEVAGLLAKEDVLDGNDTSAVDFLVETNTAKNHKPELAKAMSYQFMSDRANAAMYALVRIDATEYDKDISGLLDKPFRKADAVKGLALLGAKQYITQIGLLLQDDDSLFAARRPSHWRFLTLRLIHLQSRNC